MFLSTRNPSLAFSPDVSSRVTFVNFTVTPASLQIQCLDQLLKAERPDIETKRANLVRLQGEFQLRLHNLEKQLLTALNDSKGNILDDDNVIQKLEVLKLEASDITAKIQETDVIVQEVDEVSSQYTPLAESCSSIYFAMEQLSSLQNFYQFSLDAFFEIFDSVLKNNTNLQAEASKSARLEILEFDMFKVAYQRVSRALRQDDILVFAVLIAQIKLRTSAGALPDVDVQFLLTGGDGIRGTDGLAIEDVVGKLAARRLSEILKLRQFAGLQKHVADNSSVWQQLLVDARPEENIPVCWSNNSISES
eukprot:jgi/Hompol1/4275/HPOL_007024-RA